MMPAVLIFTHSRRYFNMRAFLHVYRGPEALIMPPLDARSYSPCHDAISARAQDVAFEAPPYNEFAWVQIGLILATMRRLLHYA